MASLSERDIDGLFKILDFCDRIGECIRRFGDGYDFFINDPDYRDVIKMNLFQIGEMVNTLSEECKESMQQIPWHQIYGLRNVIGHGYDKINEERIWDTVQTDIPKLYKEISKKLK